MNKDSALELGKILEPHTITGRILLSIFGLGILSIVIQGLRHISPAPIGDEYFYVQFAQNIPKNGLYYEMVHGNPIGYSLVLYFFSKIGLSVLTAGRVLSLLATIVVFAELCVIGRKYFHLSRQYLILAILTSLFGIVTSGNYIYVASDDMYYTAFFIWIAVYLWKSIDTFDWRKFAIAGALLSCTLLIRPLALFIFPVCLMAIIYSAYFTHRKLSKKAIPILAYISAFGLFFILQQAPSLVKNGRIALENKIPDSVGTRVNWVQKNELTRILKERGEKLDEGQLASWKQCKQYLDIHGNNSLPSNVVERFFRKPIRSLKYAIIGSCKIFYILLRHTGFVFLFLVLFLIRPSFISDRKIAFFEAFCISYLALYVFNNQDHVEIRQLIIPIIFITFSGVSLLQTMYKDGNKYAGVLSFVQLCALLFILLLDLGFYFLRTADWIYYC